MSNGMKETQSDDIEHQFGITLVEAAEALFSHVAPAFSAEQRESARTALAQGSALEIRVQIRPTPVVSGVVESIGGETHTIFSLVPRA